MENDDLSFRRNALAKRRAELLKEIATCSDAIAEIDEELRKDEPASTRLAQVKHALDSRYDPDSKECKVNLVSNWINVTPIF